MFFTVQLAKYGRATMAVSGPLTVVTTWSADGLTNTLLPDPDILLLGLFPSYTILSAFVLI